MNMPVKTLATPPAKKQVTLYMIGGCGLSLAEHCDATAVGEFIGFATPKFVYFDTSRSNVPVRNPGSVKILLDTDGVGKKRAAAYERLRDGEASLLIRENPPTDLNVVVFSASGGTGSVMAPLLIDDLLQMGKTVVAICVLSAECERTTKNTIDTIKTLAGISVKNKTPIVVSFHDNFGANSNINIVNQCVSQEIKNLLLLGSGQNTGLDSQDIANWVRYNSTTTHPPQLVDLLMNMGDKCEVDSAITTISLLQTIESPTLTISRAASAVGYIPQVCVGATEMKLPDTHYIITQALMRTRMMDLDQKLSDIIEAQNAASQFAYDFGTSTDFVM